VKKIEFVDAPFKEMSYNPRRTLTVN